MHVHAYEHVLPLKFFYRPGPNQKFWGPWPPGVPVPTPVQFVKYYTG